MTNVSSSSGRLRELACNLGLTTENVVVGDLGSGSLRLGMFRCGETIKSLKVPNAQNIPVTQSVADFARGKHPDLVVLVSTGVIEDGVLTPTNGLTQPITTNELETAIRGGPAVILNDAEGAAYHTLWLPWEGNVQAFWPNVASRPESQGDSLHVVVGGGLGACRRAGGLSLVRPMEVGHCHPQSHEHPDDVVVHNRLRHSSLRPSCELSGAGAIGLSLAYNAFGRGGTYDPQEQYDPGLVREIYGRARAGDEVAEKAVAKQARELGGWLGLQALQNYSGGIVIDSDPVLHQYDLLVHHGLIQAIEAAIGGGNSKKMAVRSPIGIITSDEEMGLFGGARYGLMHLAGQV